MGREENLQWFLIKRFIEILAVVGIAEYVITFLMNQYVMPVLLARFFPNYLDKLSLGGVEIFLLLVAMLLIILVSALQLVVPAGVRSTVQFAGEQIQRGLFYLLPGTHVNVSMVRMEKQDMIVFFLVMAVVTLVILLPYILGAVVFARITMREFKEIQREREAAKQEFDRKRNLMLSNIAHDLRTPMTTVAGYAKALSDGMVTDPDRRQEYLEVIQNKSVRMNDLINLLFEYVKLDSDGFKLERKQVDLCELLRENAALVYSDVESAGMELDAEIPEECMQVSVDTMQFSRVVTNLLINAVRHNPAGTRIGLLVHRDLDRIHVMIADTGPLIPEELSEKLFEPFAKADASRAGGGSGLGLSIAQKVVQMHGWELKLVQQPQIQHYPGVERYAKAFVIRIEDAE
ncbi:MAG: HAMP domain-containing histidine kinase [Lachnospiraceae bacterium]|nr:HAMP domain-containing histidine kinase [Lachnospiraceae bacterium]